MSPVERRLMTDEEKRMAQAVEPPHVTYVPGSPTKRFAREMAAESRKRDAEITESQAKYLREVVYLFRRQIPGDVVRLSGRL